MQYLIGTEYKVKPNFQPMELWWHINHYKYAVFTIKEVLDNSIIMSCSLCKERSISHINEFNQVYIKLTGIITIKKVDLCFLK